MSIAKILVPVTGEKKRDTIAISSAVEAARPFNAHVSVIFAYPNPYLAIPYMGPQASGAAAADVAAAMEKLGREAEKRAKEWLASTAAAANVKIVDRPAKADAVTCSFKSIEGFIPDTVGRAAALSDLVVFGPLSPADPDGVADSFLDSLLKVDRPVMIFTDVPARLARHIVIAWDGSIAAAHAVAAALPFLARAKQVEILSVRDRDDGDTSADLSDYLALHGISATRRALPPGPSSIAETLLAAAGEAGADLLVMGGYGHGHWREALFGGTTQHVRWHARIPVFMMH
jgi:nucleotide-binding universal stress UspA family protein